MPIWRDTLPKQSDAIVVTTIPALLRTEMEVGPAKYRLRSTKERTLVTISSVPFSRIQLDEFEDFWRREIGGGALSFTWPMGHPISDTDATFRFMSKPSFAMHNSGDTNVRFYMANLELEML